jgi:N-methylhydantoinase A
MMAERVVVGIDVGGTFTDAVVLAAESGRLLQAFKIPSTPGEPDRAVLDGLAAIAGQGHALDGALVCHGTTVGTNTLIEKKGARTALVATRGFKDVIELRRQARPLLYEIAVTISPPLVAPPDRHEIDERLAADGAVVEKLSGVERILPALRERGVEAVAVSLLHSYANSAHEIAVAEALGRALPGVFVTRSSEICPEFREYERTSTAVLNAYIGPAVSRYLERLEAGVTARRAGQLLVVKSDGGLTAPRNAARYPVHLIESGPAAGLIAASAYARAAGGRRDLIAFDMGGTTAKAGVIRGGEPRVTTEFHADRLVDGKDVGGYAIRSAVLDLVEIGAGGGSLARIDEADVLKVGPESAGAAPGPACYGRGGTLPTVTDAHAVIGTLSAAAFAESGIAFDAALARHAVEAHVARPLGWTVAQAAYAIIDIAVANMAEMVRLATVRRGLDPRDFALLASGGAGPLHAAAVGAEVGVAEAIVPPLPGMFSALGAALGQIRHELSQTVLRTVAEVDLAALATVFQSLRDRAQALFAAEPGGGAPRYARFVEMRFQGQLFELRVPLDAAEETLPDLPEIERRFRAQYRAEYGFDLPDAVVQVVNARLEGTRPLGLAADALLDEAGERPETRAEPVRRQEIIGRDGSTVLLPVVRAVGSPGATVTGPALIEHAGSTVWIHDGQHAEIGRSGRVLIRLREPRA